MAISHFVITSLPQDIISKIGLVDIVLNQQYDIAMESNLKFERIPQLDGYFVEDQVKFKAYDNVLGKYGNEAAINLIWREEDIANLPASADVEVTWVKDQSDVMLNVLPINQATEFIEVVEITGIKNLRLDGDLVLQGHRLSPRELLRAIFQVKEGAGFPYFQLSYRCGRRDTLEPTIYNFTVNVVSIATLTKGSVTGQTVILTDDQGFQEEWIFETGIFAIGNGYSNATAQVRVLIDAAFMDESLRNSITIEINSEQHLYENGNYWDETKNVQLNERGIAFITVQHRYLNSSPGAYAGSTTLNLLSVNNDTTIVSPTENQVAIITPVTQA